MRRTYPSIVLDILMPFDQVDVNVHPNKREVRFADTKLIYGLVYNAVKSALEEDEEYQRKTLLSMFSTTTVDEPTEKENAEEDEYVSPFDRKIAPVTEDIAYKNLKDGNKDIYVPEEPSFRPSEHRSANRIQIGVPDCFSFDDDGEESVIKPHMLFFSDSEKEIMAMQAEQKEYRIVGQFFDTYILVECNDKIIIIDQHAAHERILFDRFSEEIKNKVFVQELLFPVVTEVSEEQAKFFSLHVDEFLKMGFDLFVDENKVLVKSIPSVLPQMAIEEFILSVDVDDEVKNVTDVESFRNKVAQKACKSAIKGGDKLTDDQIKYFVDEYVKNNAPIQCPHGRPTLITMTKREIEKMFGRIV